MQSWAFFFVVFLLWLCLALLICWLPACLQSFWEPSLSIDSLHWHVWCKKTLAFVLQLLRLEVKFNIYQYFISYSSDSSVMFLLKWNRQVFFSPGRRNAPEECILYITGGTGWEALQGEDEIRRKCVLIESLSYRRFYTFACVCDRQMRPWLGMQRTAVYNIPVVLGVASSWQKYLDLPATYKTLTLGQFVIVFFLSAK